LELLWTFFKIGAFTFGGGYAMLPLIQAAVTEREWISSQALVDFVAVSESTPGPFAVNIATYVGSELCGVPGAICATLGVVLPSFLIILIVAKCYERFQKSTLVRGMMAGLKPAVVGMIATALLNVATTVFASTGWSFALLANREFYISAAIFGLCAFLAFQKKHPILIICLSALLGMIAGFFLLP
jgi:chromate transporter